MIETSSLQEEVGIVDKIDENEVKIMWEMTLFLVYIFIKL